MTRQTKDQTQEYRLRIIPAVSERTRKPLTRFVLETEQAFAAFRYDLTVEEHLERHSLVFRILGLKTPGLNLPSAGRAQFVREYEQMDGTYEVTVIGLDGKASTSTVRITPGKIEILKPPTGSSLRIAASSNRRIHD
jgi:hypothetical protein